ncbi:hypothetical protein ACFL6H_02785 [Candidatus Latescibacterota bacterium]
MHYLADSEYALLCSTDPVMWDVVTGFAGKSGIEIKLIVKTVDNIDGLIEYVRLSEEYGLNPKLTMPLFLGEHPGQQPKKSWVSRDRLAINTADIIYPVSIHPGGKLEKLLTETEIAKKIRNDFRIPWKRNSEKNRIPSYDFSGGTVNPFPDGNWLVHWTRSSQGKWPGEKSWMFIRDLCENSDIYVRNAKETLLNMLSEKRIRGSSWNIPGGTYAVSLTSLPASEAISLMKWRKRYVRYSFEPYGIAIKQDILEGMGAREIRYEKVSPDFSGDRLFIQSPGEEGDWTQEKEWRLRGDIRLDEIDPKNYFAIVYDESDAVEMKKRISNDTLYIHVLKR